MCVNKAYDLYNRTKEELKHKDLKDHGLFEAHSHNMDYTKEQFIRILEMGDIDVQNVIID